MKQRPVLIALIGYIIGILWGLYFSFSIVLFYILIGAIYFIYHKKIKSEKKRKFKLLSFQRYRRYLKFMFNGKTIFILVLFSVLSQTIILFQIKKEENLYREGEKISIIGMVISQKLEKQYYDSYQIKVLGEKNFNLLIQVKKGKEELQYGDKVKLQGEFKSPKEATNYGGYHEKNYLRTLKIIGKVKVEQYKVIAKKQQNRIWQIANEINLKIKEKMDQTWEKEKAGVLKGLLLGETTEIAEETKEKFQISNISHVLAISGLHINYLVMGIQFVFQKIIGKKKANFITIILIVFYTIITGFSPSMVRAVIMTGITISSHLFYRKSDIWNSIAISLLSILIYNPFLILHIGLQLSYLGTIGIILFYPIILEQLNLKLIKKNSFFFQKIKEIIAVSLSVQIIILPILVYHFNLFGVYFLFTNLGISFIIGPIILLAFFSLFIPLGNIPLSIGLNFLNFLANFFCQFPFSKIYLPTPKIFSIVLYLIGVGLTRKIYLIYQEEKKIVTYQRIKNLIALFRYRLHQRKRKYKAMILIFIFFIIGMKGIPKELKIHFVDVGQGDCIFIVTPQNKTILIDGGGSKNEEFDLGKRVLLPYLLDRGYKSIDYIVISHFDQDHVRFYPLFVTRNKSQECDNREAIRKFRELPRIDQNGKRTEDKSRGSRGRTENKGRKRFVF